MADTLMRYRDECLVRLMGAANVASAYRLYADLPGASFKLLGYMALISLDRDPEPWFGQGADELAVRALGRRVADSAAIKAVERAMSPLFEAGAVTTTRHSSGRDGRRFPARYRLWLLEPAPPGKRGVDNQPDETGHPAETGGRSGYAPPGNRTSTPRKPSEHPPETVQAPPGNRGAKEYEEYEEKEQERKTPNPAVDLTDRGKPQQPGQIKTGISLASVAADPDAERRRQADALTAWEAAQPAARPA